MKNKYKILACASIPLLLAILFVFNIDGPGSAADAVSTTAVNVVPPVLGTQLVSEKLALPAEAAPMANTQPLRKEPAPETPRPAEAPTPENAGQEPARDSEKIPETEGMAKPAGGPVQETGAEVAAAASPSRMQPAAVFSKSINKYVGGVIEDRERGFSLKIPSNALKGRTTITVSVKERESAIFAGAANAVSNIYSLGGTKEKFAKPLTLTLYYDESRVANKTELDIYLFDETALSWVPQHAALDAEANTLTLKLEHFSDYLVMQQTSNGHTISVKGCDNYKKGKWSYCGIKFDGSNINFDKNRYTLDWAKITVAGRGDIGIEPSLGGDDWAEHIDVAIDTTAFARGFVNVKRDTCDWVYATLYPGQNQDVRSEIKDKRLEIHCQGSEWVHDPHDEHGGTCKVTVGCLAALEYQTTYCGDSGCEEWSYYCKDGDVYQRRVCHNRGAIEGDQCFDNTWVEEKKAQECGRDRCDSWGTNYCKDGDVYHSQTCYDKGCAISQFGLAISEVMYNPSPAQGGDSGNEYVEVFNYGITPIDAKSLIISDGIETDSLQGYKGGGTIIPAWGYAIITDMNTQVYNNFQADGAAVKLAVDDNAIGAGLNNDGDKITIAQGNNVLDSMQYDNSAAWYADKVNGFGNALQRANMKGNKPADWCGDSLSPGSENSCSVPMGGACYTYQWSNEEIIKDCVDTCTDSGSSWFAQEQIVDNALCSNANCQTITKKDYCIGDTVYDRQCNGIDEGAPASKDCNDFDGCYNQKQAQFGKICDGMGTTSIECLLRDYGCGDGACNYAKTGTDPDGDKFDTECSDNCPKVYNPDQKDSDGNGVGDACEPCPGPDTDWDGIADACDNCPITSNPDQKDTNGNGIGDACDKCSGTDSDKDGLEDNCDNCPAFSNPDQADDDKGGVGNVCDNCWLASNPEQLDTDADCSQAPYDSDPLCGNDCDPVFNITNPKWLWITPEALNINPGVLTVHTRFPEPFKGKYKIVSATCDGAAHHKISNTEIKFLRTDIEKALAPGQLDTHFEVTGTFIYEGKPYNFSGWDNITKVCFDDKDCK